MHDNDAPFGPDQKERHPLDDLLGFDTLLPAAEVRELEQIVAMEVVRCAARAGLADREQDLMDLLIRVWLGERARAPESLERPTTIRCSTDAAAAFLNWSPAKVLSTLRGLSRRLTVREEPAEPGEDLGAAAVGFKVDFWPLIAFSETALRQRLVRHWQARHFAKLLTHGTQATMTVRDTVGSLEKLKNAGIYTPSSQMQFLIEGWKAFEETASEFGALFAAPREKAETIYRVFDDICQFHDAIMAFTNQFERGLSPMTRIMGDESHARAQFRRDSFRDRLEITRPANHNGPKRPAGAASN